MSRQTNALAIAQSLSAGQAVLERLKTLGIDVQTVPDCLTAMGLVKGGDVELVVLVDCPGQFDTLDTMRVLKSLRIDRYLPVLVLTCSEQAEVLNGAELIEAGVDDVLPVDCGLETLRCRLVALARLKSAYDQLRQVQTELTKTLARENGLLTQLREDNRDLKVRSITDGLTALYNYRYLMEWLRTEFKIGRRYGHDLSMIIVDIDHFKIINDENGHPFGDHVLKEVAVILKHCARESDLVARYAGDEFALVCPRAGHKEVQAVIKRILAACRRHEFKHKNKRVSVSLSLGAATYPQDPEVVSPEMLVFLADQALYHSKRQGRNGGTAWHEIEPETRAQVRRELHGPCHPLLTDDPKSRLELAAAARLLEPGYAGAKPGFTGIKPGRTEAAPGASPAPVRAIQPNSTSHP
jgi:diguanylate cyclase (GGDEF)-like protein